MKKIFGFLSYLTMPVLLALWLYTGQGGWYNLLATYTSFIFVIVALIAVAVSVVVLNTDKPFITVKMQNSVINRSIFKKVYPIVNVFYMCILIWHDKFIIGGMVLSMVILGLMINNYVENLEPSELAPEKEDVNSIFL